MKSSVDLVPCKGAFVTDAGDQVPKPPIGRVCERRVEEGRVSLRVQWLQPKGRPASWHAPADLRAAFPIRQAVRHMPASVRQSRFGEGEVCDVRTLGGREQVLVDFPEAGVRKWLPYQHLAAIRSVEQHLNTGKPDAQGDAERLRLRCLAYALELWNENTGSLSHLNIDPLPHQIHLVHRILRSGNLNWLIADDVGLGKTIEVGMLLSALKQRGAFRRILVVCPPGIMQQWQEELRYKFGMEDFLVYGRDFDIHEPHHWKLYDHVIGSIDRFKHDNHIDTLLQAEPWDLIIFDEAHRLSRRQYGNKLEASQRFDLAAKLRRRSDNFLLLTATPHQGMQDKFHALLELLRPERKHDIRTLDLNPEILRDMIIRNHKADVTDAEGNFIFRGKTTKAISVPVSEASREFDAALQAHLRRGYAAGRALGRQGQAIGFVMTVYRKLAASSVAAIHAALGRRRKRLEDEAWREGMQAQELPLWQPSLPGEADEADERYQGELEERAAAGAARQFFEGEIESLDLLIERAGRLLDHDQKLASFMSQVVDIVQHSREGEKILIFTEYRATQSYLQFALERRFGAGSVELIHGSQDYPERRAAIERFEADARFLVSTEAGGEGINLHRRCHLMVNYDLPWNPMRLVQRIGRLYRYGQKERVVVLNVHAPETIDANVVQTMYQRLAQVVHDMAVLGGEFREGLEDDILGQMADLLELDIEQVLEEAEGADIQRSQERIDAALRQAQEATERQQELFAHVTGYDPDELKGELPIGHEHLPAFVEGMFQHAGIEISQRLHQGMEWEIRLPEELREFVPGSRARMRVTLDRNWAAGRSSVHMLDMGSPLMQHLLARTRRPEFGGRAAPLAGLSGRGFLAGVLRWQNSHGQRMRQEFAAVQVTGDGRCFVNPPEAARWLLLPASRGEALYKGDEAKRVLALAEAATDRRLGAISNTDLHPENRQWVAAGWLG